MQITAISLENFRSIRSLELRDLGQAVVLVSPNGGGKSSVLEAIIGAHDAVSSYEHGELPFHENVNSKRYPAWPGHLRPPVKQGAALASLRVEVLATGDEEVLLNRKGISARAGSIEMEIEPPRSITRIEADPLVRELFQYHRPSSGVGYVDYIRAVRWYPFTGVGPLTDSGADHQIKQSLGDFIHGMSDPTKFSDFKTFIAASGLSDISDSVTSGSIVDSIAPLREAFGRLLVPKRFLGVRRPGAHGSIEVQVQTPWGNHDTDLLSDGEKEVLNILTHLFRYRSLANVVLWDAPESHLNGAVEARLYDVLLSLAPKNQWWFATHGLGIIGSVATADLVVLQQTKEGTVGKRAGEAGVQSKVQIYRDLGADVGMQLVSSAVVFVEGKSARSDKRSLERILGPSLRTVTFVAGGDSETILALGSRANTLLSAAVTNGDFLAVVDRDYRDDAEVERIARDYAGRVFVWDVHELENLFLGPELVRETLALLDGSEAFSTDEAVSQALESSAKKLREWIAADWARWDAHQALKRPAGWIDDADPLRSLREYAARLGEAFEATSTVKVLEDAYARRLSDVDRLLKSRRWLARLPGKELLRVFLKECAPTVSPERYLSAAVGTVARSVSLKVPEIERLRRVLEQIVERRVADLAPER